MKDIANGERNDVFGEVKNTGQKGIIQGGSSQKKSKREEWCIRLVG